jgi:glycosyltransferase involved in cell wall biosynthesis
MTEKYIIMLDPKGVISRDHTTVERHIKYGDVLHGINSNYRLLIFTSTFKIVSTPLLSEPTQIFELVRREIRLLFSLKVRMNLRQRFDNVSLTFIVGDPWAGYYSYKVITAFRRRTSQLQVQIHAEIGNPVWYRSSLRNFIKHILAGIALRDADVIRVVSSSQKKDIENKYGIPSGKMVVIPPLLNVIPASVSTKNNRPRVLAFIGRIDLDRGTELLVSLCSRLNLVDSEFRVEVIGDGPEIANLRSKIEAILGLNRVKFHGSIDTEKLNSMWKHFGVLISLSETESYGRTIREAIYSGLPVWSTSTSGLKELINERGRQGIEILEPDSEPEKLLKTFNSLLDSEIQPLSHTEIEDLQSVRIKALCNSWISLSEVET